MARHVVLCGLQLCLSNICTHSKIPLIHLTCGQTYDKLLKIQDYHVVPILTKALTGIFRLLGRYNCTKRSTPSAGGGHNGSLLSSQLKK